jgi:hypothetical protein
VSSQSQLFNLIRETSWSSKYHTSLFLLGYQKGHKCFGLLAQYIVFSKKKKTFICITRQALLKPLGHHLLKVTISNSLCIACVYAHYKLIGRCTHVLHLHPKEPNSRYRTITAAIRRSSFYTALCTPSITAVGRLTEA